MSCFHDFLHSAFLHITIHSLENDFYTCSAYFSAGATDYLCIIDEQLLSHAEEEYGYFHNLMVDEAFKAYADTVCEDFGLHYPPKDHEQALFLHFLLIDDINELNK